MNYRCATCKNIFNGIPAMSNNCGHFCPSCDATRKAKAADGTRARYEAIGTDCMYCGARGPHFSGKKSSRVCGRCDSGRDWLLRCIRYSDHVAAYVEKTEAAEKEARKNRQATEARARLESQQTKAAVPAAHPSAEPKTETRLDRLEAMLEKLTSALGGV